MQSLLSISLSLLTLKGVTAQYVANTQALTIKEIEHLYFDAAPAGILSAVTPCSNYYDPSTGNSNNALGRNTAAEWIRTAFRKLSCSYVSCDIENCSMVFEIRSLQAVIAAPNVTVETPAVCSQ